MTTPLTGTQINDIEAMLATYKEIIASGATDFSSQQYILNTATAVEKLLNDPPTLTAEEVSDNAMRTTFAAVEIIISKLAAATSDSGITLSSVRTRERRSVPLVGVKNSINLVFTLPNSEKFIHTVDVNVIAVYVNGVRKTHITNFTVSESVAGQGFNKIHFIVAPAPADVLLVDYTLA